MDYIIYFILTIGILVFVHEFGHFLAARICKIRTDVFAIGFGKRLFGWNKVNGFTVGDLPKDIDLQGHTDYRLSMLPLGGYVKIAGMVDESFDTSFKDEEPKPYEFRSKPTYQKLFVITAGVLMNLFLTIAIFTGINYFQGKEVIKTTLVGNVQAESFAYDVGFRTGDKILSINDKPVSDWESVYTDLLLSKDESVKKIDVIRDGQQVLIAIPQDSLNKAAQQAFFLPVGEVAPIITDVIKDSPAEDAGIKKKDLIIRIADKPINSSSDVIDIISSNPDHALSMVLLRGKDTVVTAVTPSIDGKIGIGLRNTYMGPSEYKTYSLPSSLSQGISDVVNYVELTYVFIERVFAGKLEVGQAFGGPVKIAQLSAESADLGLVAYLKFLAVLSLSLAILNILPFPVLDGGHFVIILIEGIMRREIPIKIKMAIQNVGFIILLLLMAFIIYNDIINL
ncbi:Membrane-associated zinc metalloprotease [hydrothermal vent metagenome]|uniref:Membrane-associated zinc metalloprotease n=1 Tax=hydrothermal vent metagenome TaxID=652676 RepID=A0A3B1D0P9_9ZZZZ